MTEEFRDIVGFEGLYQVSNSGNVKSLRKNIILKPSKDGNGYLFVVLYITKQNKKLCKIHKLVATAFLGHKTDGFNEVVDHINNNRLDNKAENLQLITSRENSSKDKPGSTSKHIGVCYVNKNQKWQSVIYVNNRHIYLGLFKDEAEASEIYQKALNNLKKLDRCKTRDDVIKLLNINVRKKTSNVVGVAYCRFRKKWVAYYNANNKTTNLGGFLTEQEAITRLDNFKLELKK